MRREEMGENLVRIGMEGRITRELGLEMPLLQPQILLGEKTRDCRVVPRNVNPINARNPIVRACYKYGSTDHINQLVLDIEPSELGFSYEIEIASGQLVEIDKAEIICHEKVVRIPLLDDKVLRVLGEKLEENMRQLTSAKAKEKKQEEIVVVRDFPEVFPDDLSGLLPV
uniref:Reverse transcriptase domain-containing protein n=1 Tax=Tanacetum cinerariifolium TaxID=118510 RepID=A0A699HAL3_TANCI|nr:hypothetical protein [Tanacetum cinerariifolium]